jgi:putative ABC transport system permease protein
MLFGNRGKAITLIFGLAFATTLIVQQGSIFTGIMRRTGVGVLAVPQADIWVMYPETQYFDERKPLEATALQRVWGIDGVDSAIPMFVGSGIARLSDGSFASVQIIGVERNAQLGLPSNIAGSDVAALDQPDAIFWDNLNIPLYQNVKPGDVLEINDHRAQVMGLALGPRAFTANPIVYTTYERALAYSPGERRRMTFILVRVAPGADAKLVADRIHAVTGLAAKTKDEFFWSTVKTNFKRIPAAINFSTIIALGIVVGIAIVTLTFFNFILENMRYFGMLKALGTRNRTLIKMVLLQATTVGLVGWGLGVGAAALFGMNVGPRAQIAFLLTPHLFLGSLVLVLLMVWLAAALSIRDVLRIEPAIVFR